MFQEKAGMGAEGWIDIREFISKPDEVTKLWIKEIENALDHRKMDFRYETFLRAGMKIYSVAQDLKAVSVRDVYETAGYSKSTFHRIFDTFPRYQLKLYQSLCDLAIDVYERHLSVKRRSPEEFCRFSLNVIYSSHLTVPSAFLANVYHINAPITPQDFHPHVSRMAEVMHSYMRENSSEGFRRVNFSGFREVIRTLDYDILFSKIEQPATFPSVEQADRLERLLLAYVS